MKTREIVPVANKGKIIPMEVKSEYIAFLKKYIPDFSNLKVAIDCSNGMAALLIKDLLGDAPTYIYDDLDGTFPNHEANPLVMKNVQDLMSLVKKEKADIGIIFDGDADRVMFVDENSDFISPDLMIAVIAHYYLEEKGLKGKVLQDIRTSKAVGEYIKQFDCDMEMWRVGRAFAAVKLREIDGIYGGELAGHYYFKDFFYSDSGLLACLIILDVVSKMKKKGISVSQLISKIRAYANSGEINFKINQKQEAMDALREHFNAQEKPTASFDFDGYRLEYKDWWFNVRPSNTEPYLRFLAEGRPQEFLDKKVAEAKEIISKFN